ncbi:hypothetical protein [Streptomyces sp. SID3343]|uniref:hypothetical protein n=1 Tax=Streptomyces sp. SID3343 TaxID=2690260 RepID=UPI0013696F67|nr:hypothetical protein [Streptomyces sp. SID3343]MYW05915.1 hypothetical protein [Streptomyces sp. SID3343]
MNDDEAPGTDHPTRLGARYRRPIVWWVIVVLAGLLATYSVGAFDHDTDVDGCPSRLDGRQPTLDFPRGSASRLAPAHAHELVLCRYTAVVGRSAGSDEPPFTFAASHRLRDVEGYLEDLDAAERLTGAYGCGSMGGLRHTDLLLFTGRFGWRSGVLIDRDCGVATNGRRGAVVSDALTARLVAGR